MSCSALTTQALRFSQTGRRAPTRAGRCWHLGCRQKSQVSGRVGGGTTPSRISTALATSRRAPPRTVERPSYKCRAAPRLQPQRFPPSKVPHCKVAGVPENPTLAAPQPSSHQSKGNWMLQDLLKGHLQSPFSTDPRVDHHPAKKSSKGNHCVAGID